MPLPSPQFWFYSPRHSPCEGEVVHCFSREDEPCHCGTWTWDGATRHSQERSAAWHKRHSEGTWPEPKPHPNPIQLFRI